MQYVGGPTMIGEVTTSGQITFPAADSSPLAIIAISLKGMGQTSAVPQQTLALIQHYYTGNRNKDLIYVELEFCLRDGTEDTWIKKLDKAIVPLLRYV